LHLAITKAETGKQILTRILQLLKHGADPNIQYRDGSYPLFSGLRNVRPWGYELLTALLEHGADPNIDDSTDIPGWTPLMFAIRHNDCAYQENRVKKLLEHRAEVFTPRRKGGFSLRYQDYNGWTALHAAVEQGQLNIVKLLLNYGADSRKGYTSKIYIDGKFKELTASQVMDHIPHSTQSEINIRAEIWRLVNP
jgi:ankyrin repeat protein